jgi:3-hydroxybutyryl-CoA dehydratase
MDKRINFDNINPGDEIPPLYKQMTQEMINGWADAVKDYNPLHVDPEYAKKTKFKSTIAPGPLVISYISEMMDDWLGIGWIEGGKLLNIKFNTPVKPGDKITIAGRIKEKRVIGNERIVECEVFVKNQDGVKAVVGIAVGLVE